jgi:hypothetical protein
MVKYKLNFSVIDNFQGVRQVFCKLIWFFQGKRRTLVLPEPAPSLANVDPLQL